MDWKKMVGTWGIAIVVGFYTTFVLQALWNWFAVQAFGAPHISYWMAYGFVLTLRLILDEPPFEKQEIYGRLEHLINACIPEEKREVLNEELLEEGKEFPARLGGAIFGQVVGLTLTLAIGWAVHTFLV